MTRGDSVFGRAPMACAAALGLAMCAAAPARQSGLPEPAPSSQPPPAQPPATQPPPLLPRQERGDLVFDNIPAPDPALATRLARYLQSRQATLLDWLPDGSHAHRDPVRRHRAGTPGRLALGRARAAHVLPRAGQRRPRRAESGGGFVFLKDKGGDENSQVYYRAPDGGVRELTHGDFIHGHPVWAHDGRRVAFYGNDRDGASYDVYVADVMAARHRSSSWAAGRTPGIRSTGRPMTASSSCGASSRSARAISISPTSRAAR